ncbi:hypothetical protein [Flammeovirga aprica]|uniref:Uncharacterized protein n=1 Tax=Flammeovirga aprica JL-4 TaxID=694437 RepID=A0A7X9S187_9BACT|nr:hypothetical protein [Flammeovirga aprica]NME72543.1 hypothetical protein [Flammeovirga aprica JL-4]
MIACNKEEEETAQLVEEARTVSVSFLEEEISPMRKATSGLVYIDYVVSVNHQEGSFELSNVDIRSSIVLDGIVGAFIHCRCSSRNPTSK